MSNILRTKSCRYFRTVDLFNLNVNLTERRLGPYLVDTLSDQLSCTEPIWVHLVDVVQLLQSNQSNTPIGPTTRCAYQILRATNYG